MKFTPDYAIDMIQSIRIKHEHPTTNSKNKKCFNTFELDFSPFATQHVSYWGQGHQACLVCVPKDQGSVQFVRRMEGVLQNMYAEGKVSTRRLIRLFDMLEAAMRRPQVVDP